MKTNQIFPIGTRVQWVDKNQNFEGTVRDDLAQDTVMINVSKEGMETVTINKIRLIKRTLLEIVKKENKMEKKDVKLVLLQAKLKKYSTPQLVDKYDKAEGDEKTVIYDLLSARKVEGFTENKESVEEQSKQEVVKEQEEEIVDAIMETETDKDTKSPKIKVVRKKVENSSIVEFEDDEPTQEQPTQELPKKEKSKKSPVVKKVVEKTDKKVESSQKGQKLSQPKEGTKSAEIYEYLKANPEEKLTTVAKKFETYYSVVDRVVKVYMK